MGEYSHLTQLWMKSLVSSKQCKYVHVCEIFSDYRYYAQFKAAVRIQAIRSEGLNCQEYVQAIACVTFGAPIGHCHYHPLDGILEPTPSLSSCIRF